LFTADRRTPIVTSGLSSDHHGIIVHGFPWLLDVCVPQEVGVARGVICAAVTVQWPRP
jgi:hypothetical protein